MSLGKVCNGFSQEGNFAEIMLKGTVTFMGGDLQT